MTFSWCLSTFLVIIFVYPYMLLYFQGPVHSDVFMYFIIQSVCHIVHDALYLWRSREKVIYWASQQWAYILLKHEFSLCCYAGRLGLPWCKQESPILSKSRIYSDMDKAGSSHKARKTHVIYLTGFYALLGYISRTYSFVYKSR